jgi:hypothetical protein
MRWHLSASLLLHAALLLALILLQPLALPKAPAEQKVNVVIVTEPDRMQPIAGEDRLRPALDQQRKLSPLAPEGIIQAEKNHAAEKIAKAAVAESKPPAGSLIPATHLYADATLADRHNRSAREAMKTLAGDERMIQLCDIEAMEQVKRASATLRPDYVIAYAMADLKLSADEVDAEGGAFLSHRNWYGLKFRCSVSPADGKVTAFAFLVGQPIPRAQWAAHNLTADANPDD